MKRSQPITSTRLAGPPFTGWILPVEPLIDAGAHPEIWRDVLALVRQRAR